MVLNDAELYYSLDDADLTGSNPNDISGNGRDGTNNGADTGATGDINEAFDNVAANADYLDCNYDMGATDWTICMKANVDSIASDYGYFSTYSGGTANGIALINDVSVPNINIQSYAGGVLQHFISTNEGANTGTWYDYVITMTSGSTCTVYINATNEGSESEKIEVFSQNTSIFSDSAFV